MLGDYGSHERVTAEPGLKTDPKHVVTIDWAGTPVVPFFPCYFGVSLLKLKKGALMIMGLLGNLGGQGPNLRHLCGPKPLFTTPGYNSTFLL